MIEYYSDLAEQLANMPGGAHRLRQEFFAAATLENGSNDQCWQLASGGAISLKNAPDGHLNLIWQTGEHSEALADYPPGLLEAAQEFTVPLLGLAFLVLVMGGVSDGGKLKKCLPEVNKCAKSLLLIAVCRLCG